jgi:hypothetical protein
LHNLVDLTSIQTSFVTGKSSLTDPADADSLLVYDASANAFKKLSLATLRTSHANVPPTVSTWAGILSSDNSLNSGAHGWAGVPQFVRTVLVCITADLGYTAGQEVDVSLARTSGGGEACIFVRADATTLYIFSRLARPYLLNVNTTSYAQTTAGRWSVKTYHHYYA